MRRAYAFAEAAHRGQRRKDGRAFITHPVRVARLLASRGYDEEVLAAALLHDVVEDTAITLTEDPDLPVVERKRAYRDALRRSPHAARAICAADKVCNLADLHEAASSGTEQVLARFHGGLDGQVELHSDALSMLEETDADRALREAMRAELGALRAQARRRGCGSA